MRITAAGWIQTSDSTVRYRPLWDETVGAYRNVCREDASPGTHNASLSYRMRDTHLRLAYHQANDNLHDFTWCASHESAAHSRDMQTRTRCYRRISATEAAAWVIVLVTAGAALWEFFRWLGSP